MELFLAMYGIEIASVLVCIVAFLILWYFKKKPLVKKIIYSLVSYAEKKFGSGTGEIKYATVLSLFYTRMPFLIRLVFTEAMLDNLIEEAVTKLKKELAKGTDLLGIAEECKP